MEMMQEHGSFSYLHIAKKKTKEKKDDGEGNECTLLRGRAEEREMWAVGAPAPGGGREAWTGKAERGRERGKKREAF